MEEAIAYEQGSLEIEPIRLSSAMTFTIESTQMKNLQEWRRSHGCKCRNADGTYDISSCLSSTGELETFRFTPTSVGVVVTVCQCACGAEVDLTDFSVF